MTSSRCLLSSSKTPAKTRRSRERFSAPAFSLKAIDQLLRFVERGAARREPLDEVGNLLVRAPGLQPFE